MQERRPRTWVALTGSASDGRMRRPLRAEDVRSPYHCGQFAVGKRCDYGIVHIMFLYSINVFIENLKQCMHVTSMARMDFTEETMKK